MNKLTNQEKEILQRLTTGESVFDIAGEIGITDSEVSTKIRTIVKKLGQPGLISAINRALELNLISRPVMVLAGRDEND